MAGRHHWYAIAVRDGLVTRKRKRDEDPDPASVAAHADGVTYCTPVLPWLSCGTGRPWRGRAVAAQTRAATSALTAALLPGNTIWGGDWNPRPQRTGVRRPPDDSRRRRGSRVDRGDRRVAAPTQRPLHGRPHR